MYSTVNIFFVTLSLGLFSVNAELTCNQTIIDNILKLETCPTNILQKMQSMSPMTTALLHETNVHDDIKCSKLIITFPDDKKAFANLTVYFKNEPPKQAYCGQEEVGCGHINALYDDLTLQVYFLNTDKVICVYRCPTAPMKGFAGAGALVPMATQNLPEVLAQVQSCKESLAAVGVSGNLVDVEKCSD